MAGGRGPSPAVFHNMWSVWTTIVCSLVLILIILVAWNEDRTVDDEAVAWGAVLAPAYIIVALFACMILAVCASHRMAFADDPNDEYARRVDRSLRELCPALVWDTIWVALLLAFLITLNVRLDKDDDGESPASWSAPIALGLTLALSFCVYWLWASLVQCAYARHATPPPMWTRCVDVFVCCMAPRNDYDDDEVALAVSGTADDELPKPVTSHDTDAPILLYECSAASCFFHAGCCRPPTAAKSAQPGPVARALTVMLVTTFVLYVAYVAGLVSFGLLLPYLEGRSPTEFWQVMLATWIASVLVVAAVSVLMFFVGQLTVHRYATVSLCVGLVWFIGFIIFTFLVAFVHIDPTTTSYHVYAIPLYIVTSIVICFFCCAATANARTGAVATTHGYHLATSMRVPRAV